MQSQAESQSSAPMVPSAKQMSALGFHAVSNFMYAEGMGAAAGAGATLFAAGSAALGAGSIPMTIASIGIKAGRDYLTGSKYYDVLIGGSLAAISHQTKVPLGGFYSGFRYGQAAYQWLLPPPQPIGK